MQKIKKTVILKNFFLKVNRKGIYFIWVRLKIRKAELKQQVRVSLGKYMLACFAMIVDTIKDLFSNSQNQVFLEFQRIKTFQTLHRELLH